MKNGYLCGMNESGPVRKTRKDPEAGGEFCDFLRLAPNIWRATKDGKYWILKTAKSEESASVELLRREYDLSCNLSHPFIAGALGFEPDSPKGPAIIMEYIDGRTLREFIAEKPSVSVRKKVLHQILTALEYLHHKGLLHNDLKPENILISAIGNDVKIIDFGLSETDADYLNKRLGGTAGASAPEVFSGNLDSPSSCASDIYSLGGIVRLLFPKRYSAIVRKCLREDPQNRYRTVAELRRALARHDRRPWWLLAVAVVCALLAAAIVPDVLRKYKELSEEELFQQRIAQIQADMTVFYQAAADTISNRDLVPYLEFGYPPLNTFVMCTAAYKDSLENDLHPVCDSIYERMLRSLTEMMQAAPKYWEVEKTLPLRERRRIDSLLFNGLH